MNIFSWKHMVHEGMAMDRYVATVHFGHQGQ